MVRCTRIILTVYAVICECGTRDSAATRVYDQLATFANRGVVSAAPIPARSRIPTHGTATTVDEPRVQTARRAVALARWEWAVVGSIGVWLTAAMLWRWPAFSHEAFRGNSLIDLAFYSYAGDLVRTGGTPYLTFWDHKPPLIFLLHAGGLAISGGRVWGVWLVSYIALLTAAWCLFRAMRHAFGAAPAALGLTFFAFSVPNISAFGLTEWFALPIGSAAALVTLRRDPREQNPLLLGMAIGALGAAAVLFKPNLIGGPFVGGVVASVLLLADRRIGAWVRLAAGSVLGAALVLGPMLGYLVAKGAFAAFRDQVVYYNRIYVGTGPGWRLRLRALDAGILSTTAYTNAVLPFAGWALAVYHLVRRGLRAPLGPALLLAVIWLPVEIAFALTSGRDYSHYFTPYLPPLALLVACLGSELVTTSAFDGAVGRIPRRPVANLIPVLGMTIAVVGVWRMFWRERDDTNAGVRAAQIDATASYVRRNVRPGAPIFVWGHAADVYMLSGHRPASRFVYVQPLLTPGYATPARVHAFVDELRASAPPVIIDAGGRDATTRSVDGADLTPSLGRMDSTWSYPLIAQPNWKGPSWWSMPVAMGEFYKFVAANYVATDSLGAAKWVVYRRIAPGLASARTSPLAPVPVALPAANVRQ